MFLLWRKHAETLRGAYQHSALTIAETSLPERIKGICTGSPVLQDASQKRLVKGHIPTQPKNFVTRQAPAATIGQLQDVKGVVRASYALTEWTPQSLE